MVRKTQIIKVNPEIVQDDKMDRVVKILKEGGMVVYPTDTFYGLGADCYREKALEMIYRLKKREYDKPIPLVISEMDTVRDICVDIPPAFKAMAQAFWPGPLTLILKASSRLPGLLLGKEGSIGVRMPDFYWVREMISRAGFPLTATSANISGKKGISQPEKIMEVFDGKVDLIVDGGKTPGGLPSTVVDLTSIKPQILREGAIPSVRLTPYL